MVQLYEKGGVYLDTDIVPVLPFRAVLQEPKVSFVSTRSLPKLDESNGAGIFQAMLAVSAKNEVIRIALEKTAKYYQRKVADPEHKEDELSSLHELSKSQSDVERQVDEASGDL
jgi:hypothetical protein